MDARAPVPEARIVSTGDGGAHPDGDGWFVVNAREAQWLDGPWGAYTRFESPDHRFARIGVNIGVLQPGQPACLYHREDEQEDFLVLAGEALLIVEGEQRPLRAWDFVHCPPWTEHVFVGAGDGPCTILALGGRTGGDVVYPVDPVAAVHGASVADETDRPETAYAASEPSRPVDFDERWLP